MPLAAILPTIDMIPASYSVRGAGPEGSSFSVSSTSRTIEVLNLRYGTWNIVVEAFNGDPKPLSIGSGTVSVTIVAGRRPHAPSP